MVIGGLAALIMLGSVRLVERMRVDDVVGAFSVHGAAGLWGMLAVGLFADGTYGNYTTDARWLPAFSTVRRPSSGRSSSPWAP